MKITSTTLARLCVALLVIYPISAILLWAYLAHDNSYGIMAALLAANAGTALFVGLAFDLPEFSHYTSRALRLTVITIGIVSGLVSAQFWMADEVGHIWFRAAIVSPVLVILIVLMSFVAKVNKEGTNHEDE